jgi:hypothetical protein
VLSGNPQRVELASGATTNFNIIVGDLFKFQGENAWFQIANIISASEFDLTANYTGTKAFDTFLPYLVVRDFTPRFEFPELAPGDIDIRDVYTLAMRMIDAAIGGSAGGILAEFSFVGNITVGAKPFRWYPPIPSGRTAIVQQAALMIGTAPTGQPLVVDVNKNGLSVFSGVAAQPQLAVGQNFGISGLSGIALSPTDFLTIDVDQVGSGVPGADLVVQVRF